MPARRSLLRLASLPLLGGLLFWLAASPAQAEACDPTKACCGGSTPGGATCGGEGAASQGNNSGTNQGAGNPINVITGNKFQQETDLPALPGVLGLEIVRYYNSQYSLVPGNKGILGRGWRLSYETTLQDLGDSVRIVQADGTPVLFRRGLLEPDRYRSGDPQQGVLSLIRQAGRKRYAWRWPNGRVLSFDEAGRLERISAPSGEAVSLSYDPRGALIRVVDPQGRALQLNYHDAAGGRYAGVRSIDSPVGRFAYAYGSPAPKGATAPAEERLANLAGVAMPAGVSRRYHYEDPRFPMLLTGISVHGKGSDGRQLDQRIGSYGYDAAGRANLTVRGEPARRENARLVAGTGIEQVALSWPKPGLTVLVDSQGQRTEYRSAQIAGQPRLLEVRGAGCSSCGPTDMRYGYDGQGRLRDVTRLDRAGQPIETTRTERDALGRTVRTLRIAYAGGKAAAPQLLARYEYAAADGEQQPLLIAKPSVLAGREHQWRFRYNAQGQPLEISETGYGPLDGEGSVATAEQAVPQVLTTRYRYRQIAGRSLLAEIDGPLPNGPNGDPTDSDVTRFDYDAAGHAVVAVLAPGGLRTEMRTFDAAGRPTTLRRSDGVRSIEAVLAYDPAGTLQAVTQTAGFVDGRAADGAGAVRRQRFFYDANRRLTRTVTPDQVVLRTEYGPDGRQTGLVDARGNRIDNRYDSEGRLLAATIRDAAGRLLGGELDLRDERGALRARLTPVGLQMAQGTGPLGDQAVQLDGAGYATATVRSENGVEVLAADRSTRQFAANRGGLLFTDGAGRPHGLLKDDFGRTVLEVSPDEGRIAYRHRAAAGSAIVEKIHTALDGSSRTVETRVIDAAGRLVRRDRPGCSESLRYQGGLLARLDGCGNSRSYARDAFGQITEDVQTIVPADAAQPPVRFAAAYAYEAGSGRLATRRLPDGQRLGYRYDAVDGKLAAVYRDAGWLAWIDHTVGAWPADRLRALLPRSLTEEAVASAIEWQPFGGIAGLTHGNGLVQRSRFDAAGRTTALEVGTAAKPAAVEKLDYRYDGGGNLAATVRGGQEFRYAYDPMRRLAAERPTVSTLQVAYNRLAQPALRDADYRYDALGDRRDAAAERDRFGRQVRRGEQNFVYDDAHRLVEVRQGSRSIARYRYDVLGNRIAKTVGDRTTYFVYDTTHRLIAEADATGRVVSQYLYGDHRPYAAMRSDGGQARALYAVHADPRGLPLAVTDAAQRVVWQGDFDAFGNPYARPDGAVQNFAMPLRLAGQYADDETGLYYNVHRYYDPSQGRYLTPDPLGLAGGEHAYAYVGGNPLAGIDPLGLFHIPGTLFAGKSPLNGFWDMPIADGGHGDIVRIAFSQYMQQEGQSGRFSDQFIDWVVRNNYHSDVNGSVSCYPTPYTDGGGQCNPKNHFDNPNDGPMYTDAAMTQLTSSYQDGKNDNWIQDSLDHIKANRNSYQNATFAPNNGVNISRIVAAFGQNLHALGDFYSHTNWVDAATRGGCVLNKGWGQTETGYIPVGLEQTTVWDEQVRSDLFTGTVAGMNVFCSKPQIGDVGCPSDKTTHGYWNKDGAEELGGKQAYEGPDIFGWRVEEYNPKKPPTSTYGTDWYSDARSSQADLKKGDRILVKYPVKTKHALAFYLAVEHTKLEIAKLFDGAGSVSVNGQKLTDIFQMDKKAMKDNHIVYDDNISKL